MLKNKPWALVLIVLGYITLPNTTQARQVITRQPVVQAQPQLQPPVQQPIALQQPVQQPVAAPAPQRATRGRQVGRQTQPKRQINRRSRRVRQAQPPAVVPVPVPVQQPIVIAQPVQLPLAPPAQQPTVQANVPTAPRLSDFDFHAASVLPTFIDKSGKKYLILSREAHGKDKNTYDDFGGKRDYIGPKKNNIKEAHPFITAAREFFEEAILNLSINISLKETQDFIDLKNPYTQYVIAYGHNVTYITDFTPYANRFFAHFYNAFITTASHHSQEKDRIAVVEWDYLKAQVQNTHVNSGLIIDAEVLDPANNQWYQEKITLRGFFVKKLRPFWMDTPYQQGMSRKVHFY